MPSRFDAVVATTVAAAIGTIVFFLVGMELIVFTLLFVPVLAPVLLGVAALAGVGLAVRGARSARGFGVGMVIGWVLLAFWSSGVSVGVLP